MQIIRITKLLLLLLAAMPLMADPQSCTYQTYKWNVKLKKAVDREKVSRPYSELKNHEVDPRTGCSVCQEDQVKISLPGVKPFKLCKHLAPHIKDALTMLIRQGEPINEVIGYRVGMTRGDTDAQHNRTKFSNHSFGIALDINPQQNGLYDRCIDFGPSCRLIRGGEWQPAKAGSLTGRGPVVIELERLGLQWGGRILGKQKDFMHFSPSGY